MRCSETLTALTPSDLRRAISSTGIPYVYRRTKTARVCAGSAERKRSTAAVSSLLKGGSTREQRILRSRDYVRRFEGGDVARQVLRVYDRLLNR